MKVSRASLANANLLSKAGFQRSAGSCRTPSASNNTVVMGGSVMVETFTPPAVFRRLAGCSGNNCLACVETARWHAEGAAQPTGALTRAQASLSSTHRGDEHGRRQLMTNTRVH